MLELRLNCENCNKTLPVDSTEAMICSYECTYCKDCVEEVLNNVCPNCGGGFEKRPVRPKDQLLKYPPSDKHIHNEIDQDKFSRMRLKFENISPEKR
ncbi:MAG: DUF1272 domain-containing protein [bacterium]|nr:DUF1272 domain-containing protein [bacterium]